MGTEILNKRKVIMTNEEAKKAGFRTASGALYVYWCIENGHIYVRSCDACALTGNDFPTRAKAREALRKQKSDAEHAKWLADMQSQMTPITPEQAKHKPCDMPDEITFNGAEYRRLADNEQHKDGDIPVDGSQTHRFGSIWYRPVESHETLLGETQGKEVVTDETQPKPSCDAVSHPSHYTSHPSGVECITITKHMNFCRGNAVKYLWRAGQKGDSIDKEIEDIAKAEEYCRIEKERLIAKKGAK